MRGISEERLREIFSHGYWFDGYEETENLLLSLCKELTPWLPIATAPKDRTLIGLVDGKIRLIKWGKTSHVPLYGFCLADQGVEDFDICHPTHYMELPEDPRE